MIRVNVPRMASTTHSSIPPRPRLVCIGGGAGPSLVVKSFPELIDTTTAIVTVTDSGSSTGTIRSNFRIAAPGDIRATLSLMSHMSGGDDLLPRLMEYRFQPREAGQLSNMAFGNLFLAALCKVTGDFKAAIDVLSRMLSLRGTVLPVSLDVTDLAALLEDNTVVTGEVEVRRRHKPRIKRVFLTDESADTYPEVVHQIMGADVVFLGPGNLFTSILACVLFPGVRKALAQTRAQRVFLCNTTTSPGQTDGFTLADHVSTLLGYLDPGSLQLVLFNDGEPDEAWRAAHAGEGVHYIPHRSEDDERAAALGLEVLRASLLEPPGPVRKLHKHDTLRHDPVKLRDVLLASPRLGPILSAPAARSRAAIEY